MTRRGFLLAGGAGTLAVLWIAVSNRRYLYSIITDERAGGTLDALEAHDLVQSQDLVLVDIRRPDEWAATGRAEGSVPLDMRRSDFTEALAQVTGGDRSAPIALICARGVRSARLSNRLIEAGFTNVRDVPEGMLGSASGPGWLARGLPLAES